MRIRSSLLIAVVLVSCDVPPGVDLEDRRPVHEEGEQPPNLGVYPKPMVTNFQEPVTDRTDAWYGYDYYRDSRPATYGITEGPRSPQVVAAEFQQQAALMIAWTGVFADVTASIIRAARNVTNIWILHDGAHARQEFEAAMSSLGVSTAGLTYIDVPLDSIWARDFGPISIAANGNRVGIIDPRYYPERVLDDAVPSALAERSSLSTFRMPVYFEGGNFMTDGNGTCFVSNGVSWSNSASTTQIRRYFREYLGCYQLVFLEPLRGEGTTHIDMFAKMVNAHTVLLGDYSPSDDPTNAEILDDNAETLRKVTLADGSKLDVVRIPMPGNWDGNFRTYVNTQLINGVNLIPVYSDDRRYEDQALQVWKQALPTWRHVSVDATELITWAGAVHCILKEIQEGTWSALQAAPARICQYADCYPDTGTPGVCGGVPVSGSCASGTATWCEQGTTRSSSCSSSCGWDAHAGHYGCGGAPVIEDPVDPVEPAADPVAGPPATTSPAGCGDISGIGCCDGSTLEYCSTDGSVSQQPCSGGCGWDASANNGHGWYDCAHWGSDPSGKNPLSCGGAAAIEEPAPAVDACGNVDGIGCCNGSKLEYCNRDGELVQQACGTSGCGWDPRGNDGSGWFDCGGAGTDPSGTYALACF